MKLSYNFYCAIALCVVSLMCTAVHVEELPSSEQQAQEQQVPSEQPQGALVVAGPRSVVARNAFRERAAALALRENVMQCCMLWTAFLGVAKNTPESYSYEMNENNLMRCIREKIGRDLLPDEQAFFNENRKHVKEFFEEEADNYVRP